MKERAKTTLNSKTNLFELHINGKIFPSTEKDRYFITENNLHGIYISDLPKSVMISPYGCIEQGGISLLSTPMEIMRYGKGKAKVIIQSCIQDIENPFSENMAIQTIKKELILQQKAMQPEILLVDYSDGFIHLHYSIILPPDNIFNIVQKAGAFESDIDKKAYDAIPDILNIMRDTLNIPIPHH